MDRCSSLNSKHNANQTDAISMNYIVLLNKVDKKPCLQYRSQNHVHGAFSFTTVVIMVAFSCGFCYNKTFIQTSGKILVEQGSKQHPWSLSVSLQPS